jgi:hypothetical protein
MEDLIQEEKKPNPLMWLLIVIIPLFTTMILFMFMTQNINPLYLFEVGTRPELLISTTNGELSTIQNTFPQFEEYFESIKISQESSPKSSNYSSESPQLEYQYDFYNKENKYLDRCKNRKIKINLTEPKFSEFTFNYKNETFSYKINLYDDLYKFTDRLKTQDCYFRNQEYINGFFKDPYNNNFIESVGQDFANLRTQGYTNDQIVEIATLFVQSIKYGTDQTSSNRYPYETFFEEEGNCLDKSIILIGILEKLGYETYIILGQSTQYHALVGIACTKGNIIYNEQEICFAETTIFTPITSKVEIEIERIVPMSNGSLIYSQDSYGPELVQLFQTKKTETQQIEAELDTFNFQSENIQREMCRTDCTVCTNSLVNFDDQTITSCYDAEQFNNLRDKYLELIDRHNNLVEQWYQAYYTLEKSMFGNIDIVQK